MSLEAIALGSVALLAAAVNGALGYGFSSLTVPVALLFLTNRELNPALVPIEVVLNAYVLWVNRAALPRVWRRAAPLLAGLVPGIAIGTLLLARLDPDWVKLATYAVLLPLVVLQAAGRRRPFRAERAVGGAFGLAVGVLYAVTTISGPPLALLLTNQGFAVAEFRAALGLIRLTEAAVTVTAYGLAGLFTRRSAGLMTRFVPAVIVGVPLGTALVRRVPPETFRRVCMSFDAWVVGFGLSKVLSTLGLVRSPHAYLVFVLVVALDGVLLVRYFRTLPARPNLPDGTTAPASRPGSV